jgi:glycosyltransferase
MHLWPGGRGLRRRIFWRKNPLISLILPVKNGMPHLCQTIEALRRQTYRDFELLVQDGGSTDGSLAYLQSIRDLPLTIVAEPDHGIGQAYNRGMQRSRGDLVGFLACDEWLDDDALEKVTRWFGQNRRAAVIYGGMRLADANGNILQECLPRAFALKPVLLNEIVPPMAAAFLNRRKLGRQMYYDEVLQTCPDFDFWLRAGIRFGAERIAAMPETILTGRADRSSMTFRAEDSINFAGTSSS